MALQIPQGLSLQGPGLYPPLPLPLPPPWPWATSHPPSQGPEPPLIQSQGLVQVHPASPGFSCSCSGSERVLLPGRETDLHLRSEEARRPAQADYAGRRTWELKATNKPRAGLGWCGRPKNNPLPPTQRCPYPSLRTCDYISFHVKGD